MLGTLFWTKKAESHAVKAIPECIVFTLVEKSINDDKATVILIYKCS